MRLLNSSTFQNFDIQRYFVQPSIEYSIRDFVNLRVSLYSARYDHKNYHTYMDYEDRIKDVDDLESINLNHWR